MKIYIAYSLAPTDQYVANLLVQQAQAKGINVELSQHSNWFERPGGAEANSLAIYNSNFVIAIISRDSEMTTSVQREIEFASNIGKPVIALIENGVGLYAQAQGVNYIYFTRFDPSLALNSISKILEERKQGDDAAKWVIAGGLTLLAIYLLGKDK